MRRYALVLALFLVVLGASAPNVRIITIRYPDGTRSGNLRYGPWIYQSQVPGGIEGLVKNLIIRATEAILQAPPGMTMEGAQGERTAVFTGDVSVHRGRITATGVRLVYSEKTGLGVLYGPDRMVQAPKPGEEEVVVIAQQMTFQVDHDISTSQGHVLLREGNQEGQAASVYYEEHRGLAIFTDPHQVVLIRKRPEGNLIIEAKEIRSLTGPKKLIALGGVILKDGQITTTGDALYYDDKTGIAIIIGHPARSVNAKEGFTLTSGTLLQNVNLHTVQLYGKPFQLPMAEFRRSG